MFNAILIDREDDRNVARLCAVDDGALPAGNVTVNVDYSTMNYKDGLLIASDLPLIATFPMVPGIDIAGVVDQSDDSRWAVGDKVVLNGYGLGERHWGGLAQRARVSGDWLVRLPGAFTTRQAAAIGTAGYTAMLCVLRLEKHGVMPGDGDILVTGDVFSKYLPALGSTQFPPMKLP